VHDCGVCDGAAVEYVVPASDPKHDAASLLVYGLSAALRPFHVRLELESWLPDGRRIPDLPYTPVANIYQLMCLQLANHVAEGAHYKRCAVDDCDNLFVRTEGYSIAGQNRLRGNHYCSVRCADRHRQQKYRREHRKKSDQVNPGPSPKSGQP